MAQILLHKQTLTPEILEKLAAEGVIAIQTEEPKDFHFLDVRVPQIEMNDMVWACLDALNTDNVHAAEARRKLVTNLAELATQQRDEKAVRKELEAV